MESIKKWSSPFLACVKILTLRHLCEKPELHISCETFIVQLALQAIKTNHIHSGLIWGRTVLRVVLALRLFRPTSLWLWRQRYLEQVEKLV